MARKRDSDDHEFRRIPKRRGDIIVWDESTGGDGPIGMIILSPFAKGNGYSNTIPYTHSSTLLTMEEIFGLSVRLGDSQNATDLSDLFQ